MIPNVHNYFVEKPQVEENNTTMSYGNHHGPGPLPNRWLYCPRNSDSFIADKFLAFKTPLSSKFSSQMPLECQFEPDMVFSFMKVCGVSGIKYLHFFYK